MSGPGATVLTRTIDVDWLAIAACRGHDPEMWAITGQGLTVDNRAAIAICRRCPVKNDCAAATHPADEGVIRAAVPIRSRDIALTLVAMAPSLPVVRRPAPECEAPSYAAYQRHRHRGEIACAGCVKAATAYQNLAARRRAGS